MESISIFEMFKIGIGPSSSHAMGPWNAAKDFLSRIRLNGKSLNSAISVDVFLFGSLAKTGTGHGTDKAIMMGLLGFDIEKFKTNELSKNLEKIKKNNSIDLLGDSKIPFNPSENIVFNYSEQKLKHSNTMMFKLVFDDGSEEKATYYSIGGGFIQREGDVNKEGNKKSAIPFPIQTASDMINWCKTERKKLAEISFENELKWREEEDINSSVDKIWDVMLDSIYEGCITDGELPGGLNVKRRAPALCNQLLGGNNFSSREAWLLSLSKQSNKIEIVTNWISCFALAVNEVNASYGRIVTAPTNGASGVIPAVLLYNIIFRNEDSKQKIRDFILVAGEIGMLFKKGATISAAAGGCQAEIGVSSAMAAGALANSMGGSIDQVLMAAEIAMEHHLGLSCDPVGGLVQIPCIERNTMGAMKALTAAQLAINSNPEDAKVSLDAVIKTMWETAQDMMSKYKETAEGGLALQISVNEPEC
jgi:L-serine dehydratase